MSHIYLRNLYLAGNNIVENNKGVTKRVAITPIVCGSVGALAILFPRGWPLACGLKDREKVPFFASFFGQAKNEEVSGRLMTGTINKGRTRGAKTKL
ncbi:hypothetical protein QNI19_17795 [Cytophagaceae bacterium DM2B3-1]|uniref:Uncharacterized protein n=1 Tax=Xanthocytophaga flava TaxID=3048013 RepID=A0ABT7CP86_9BACT|nr:hypothetical protein [Xanthocytophaga flavus]MDJ1494797.1 hypothetical protein [Xanthocytophaga flavus]